jgi:hypothetical protein
LALEEAAKLRPENAVKEAELQVKAEALRSALAAKSATEGELHALKSRVDDLSRDLPHSKSKRTSDTCSNVSALPLLIVC